MNWGLPSDWSTNGYQIDQLIGVVHWLILAVALFWFAFFVLVLWRFRAGRRVPGGRRFPVGARWPLVLALVLFAAEAVLLIFIEMPLWAERRELPPEDASFVVRVVGEQFAWNFHYPGLDGEFGPTDPMLIDAYNPIGLDMDDEASADDLVTINQLHVPFGQPVLLWLGSKDVIHNFYLPFMRVKQDVVPGRFTPVWFTPAREGISEIGCAQLCGLGHYRMRGQLTVESLDAFTAWYEDERAYM